MQVKKCFRSTLDLIAYDLHFALLHCCGSFVAVCRLLSLQVDGDSGKCDVQISVVVYCTSELHISITILN